MHLGLGHHGAFFFRGAVGVNQLNVGAKQLVVVEHLDAAEAFDLGDGTAGVLGDRQADAAREFPFFAVDLRRRVAGAAGGKAHGQKSVIRRTEPFPFDPRDIVEVRGLFGFELQVAAVAVGKARADAAVAQGAQVSVGVPAIDDIMRPVVNRRQAGINRFGNSQPGAGVGVLRRHHRSQLAHHRKIIEVAVGDHATGEAAPEMKMGVDEAGTGDAVAPVDDFGVGRSSRFAPTATSAPLRTWTSPFGISPSFGSMVTM